MDDAILFNLKIHVDNFIRASSSEADEASRRENATTSKVRAFSQISMIGKRSKFKHSPSFAIEEAKALTLRINRDALRRIRRDQIFSKEFWRLPRLSFGFRGGSFSSQIFDNRRKSIKYKRQSE